MIDWIWMCQKFFGQPCTTFTTLQWFGVAYAAIVLIVIAIANIALGRQKK